MNRLGRIVAVLAFGLTGLFSSCSGSSGSDSGTMQIESCTLGCDDLGQGVQITCPINQVAQNQEISFLFSKPVDLNSVTQSTFIIINTATSIVPAGSFLLDPVNPKRLVFRPQLTFNSQGSPVFALQLPGAYTITIPGSTNGAAGPFILSTGGDENRVPMSCSFVTKAAEDPIPGPPVVSSFVDTVNPTTGAITTGVPANGATNVSLVSKITMTFNDLMNIGTLVIPGTGNSPSITVKIDPDGNVANTGDQTPLAGTFGYVLNQLSLTTTVVFTPAQPFPGAGLNTASPRKIVVNLPSSIKDISGKSLSNSGPISFTPKPVAFVPPVRTLPTGGEQFVNLANCDQERSGAPWGEQTTGLLTPGLGGGSGRLGSLQIGPGEVVVLNTGPTFAVGRIDLVPSGFVDGDFIDMNGVQYQIFDSFGTGQGFVELEGSFSTLTLNNLVTELNNSVDPLLTPATYSIDGGHAVLITYDTPGDPPVPFTFDVYQLGLGGVHLPSPSVVSLSGPTVPGGTAHLLVGSSYEVFAGSNLLDNYDFAAFPGTYPSPINVSDGAFEFSALDIAFGGSLRFEGPNPARLLVRGNATISGVIDVTGESKGVQEADNPDGQLGGVGGPNGGDGGRGADRPDNSGTNLLSSIEPFRPWNFGIVNQGGFIQGQAGVGVGRIGTVGAGPAGVQFPQNFPLSNISLGDLETNSICESEQVGASGGGGAYALNGGVGVAVALTPVSSQFGPNAPSDTAGGDAGAVGLESPTAPANKRKLTPEKGYLRGGSGGGGGGGGIEQTRTNGAGSGDPCVGGNAVINQYRSQSAAAGGGGGGSIQVQAGRTLVLNGGIDAAGGDGGSADLLTGVVSALVSAPGGAGSGGAILVQGRNLLASAVPNRLSIIGGLGGLGLTGSVGGAGGVGLVRVESKTLPDQLAVAQIVNPIDPLDPLSANYLSVGTWVRSRFTPASFQGSQSCWMRPSAAAGYYELTFETDVPAAPPLPAVPGWDMDLVLNFGQGNVVVPYRAPNTILPGGQTYEELWGTLLDRDLALGETGAPIVVRFQGVKLAGSMANPCNVPESGSSSPFVPGSLTPWVTQPSDLNAFTSPCDMIRFVVIFDASKAAFLNIVGVTNLRILAKPN